MHHVPVAAEEVEIYGNRDIIVYDAPEFAVDQLQSVLDVAGIPSVIPQFEEEDQEEEEEQEDDDQEDDDQEEQPEEDQEEARTKRTGMLRCSSWGYASLKVTRRSSP